jgi:hypothetical protein
MSEAIVVSSFAAPDMSDSQILGLRSSWVMLRRDTRVTDEYIENQIEDMHGLPRGQMRRWREDRVPDGRDWYQLAEIMTGELAHKYFVENLVARTPTESRRFQKVLAQLMVHSAIAGLVGEPLYDAPPLAENDVGHKAPKELLYAWNRQGEKVPLSGIRPTGGKEVAVMLTAAHRALKEIEALEREEGMSSEDRMRETAQTLADLGEYLGLTPEQIDKLRGVEMMGEIPGGPVEQNSEEEAEGG